MGLGQGLGLGLGFANLGEVAGPLGLDRGHALELGAAAAALVAEDDELLRAVEVAPALGIRVRVRVWARVKVRLRVRVRARARARVRVRAMTRCGAAGMRD